MARVLPNGLIVGRIGNLIHYVVDGIQFVRIAGEAEDPRTEKQLRSRAKMRVWSFLLNSYKPAFIVGYPAKQAALFDRKEAARYNMEFAIETSFDTEKHEATGLLIPEKVKLSRGNITPPEINSCIRNGQDLELTWNPALGPLPNLFTDKLAVAAYVPGKEPFVKQIAGIRQQGHVKITLPDYENEPVHLWAFYWNDEVSKRQLKDRASEVVYWVV